MSDSKKKTILVVLIVIAAVLVVTLIAVSVKSTHQMQFGEGHTHHNHIAEEQNNVHQHEADNSTHHTEAAQGLELSKGYVKSIEEIIADAQGWMPVYKNWYGMSAPDFELKDINGKVHRLSDYKDRDVLLLFWATWCPPCRAEIPGLIRLRDEIGEDKLMILAVSDEKESVLRDFVSRMGINYAVLVDNGKMPKPFGVQRAYTTVGVPCSFFIEAGGKIKIATVGMVSPVDIMRIFQAKK